MTINVDHVSRGRYTLHCTRCQFLDDGDLDYIRFKERTHPSECSANEDSKPPAETSPSRSE